MTNYLPESTYLLFFKATTWPTVYRKADTYLLVFKGYDMTNYLPESKHLSPGF